MTAARPPITRRGWSPRSLAYAHVSVGRLAAVAGSDALARGLQRNVDTRDASCEPPGARRQPHREASYQDHDEAACRWRRTRAKS